MGIIILSVLVLALGLFFLYDKAQQTYIKQLKTVIASQNGVISKQQEIISDKL